MKHLSVKQLWMQEKVDREVTKVIKVDRSVNMSDLLTHHWTRAEGENHMSRMGVKIVWESVGDSKRL